MIKVKIDRRRKFRPAEDLCVFNTWTLHNVCDGDDYLNYESNGSYCCHKNEDSQCYRIHSDTETESSVASLVVNLGDDSQLLSPTYETSDDDTTVPVIPKVTPFVSNVNLDLCPLHGLPSVPSPIRPMRVENAVNIDDMNWTYKEVTSLCDIVKTYMLLADYPYDITLEIINRFCMEPIKRLVVDIGNNCVLEREKPIVEYKLKECEIKLTQLKVTTIPTKHDSDNETSSTEKVDNPEMSGDDSNDTPPVLPTAIPSGRPKRKIIKLINYSELLVTDDDIDNTRADPKPKRERPSLSSPSSRHMAVQKPQSKKKNPDTPMPQVKHERDKQPDKPVKFVTHKDRPRNTRAKRKVSPKSASSAKPASPIPTPTATVSDKTDLKCDINIRFKGLLKHKKGRKFPCKECKYICDSQAMLNAHRIKDHDLVICSVCNKSFSTPLTLSRHKYSHVSLKYSCNQCTESFAFKSALERHSYSHRKHALFVCHHKNCRRSYFSNNELLKHVLVHKDIVWSCPEENCDYTTYDKRLLKPHTRKHSDEKPYICGLCGKGHRYHVQYVRHVKNDECEKTQPE